MTFIFDARVFVEPGSEKKPGEFGPHDIELRAALVVLRKTYPELAEWGDLPLFNAWGDFSHYVELVNWRYWELHIRDDNFLNYLCWLQTRGAWAWGDDRNKLSQACEWKNSGAPK